MPSSMSRSLNDGRGRRLHNTQGDMCSISGFRKCQPRAGHARLQPSHVGMSPKLLQELVPRKLIWAGFDANFACFDQRQLFRGWLHGDAARLDEISVILVRKRHVWALQGMKRSLSLLRCRSMARALLRWPTAEAWSCSMCKL